MTLLLSLLLVQDPALDRLIRELDHDLIEIRERAHRRLIETGEAALPALDNAARSTDAELKTRAAAIAEIVRRDARERPHDAEQKAALILLRRDAPAESRPGSAAGEGARFDLSATPFEEGRVVTTRVFDYLARAQDSPGRGLVRFDVVSFHDEAGRELEVDRCGRCSPGKVFIWSREGSLKARVRGDQVWFSSYPLEFKDPAEGQVRKIGDFTITVAWPLLRVTATPPICERLLTSMDLRFQSELKEGVFVPGRRSRTIRCGGGRTFVARQTTEKWCDCPTGAQPVRGPTVSPGVSEFFLGRERLHSAGPEQPGVAEVEEDALQLKHVSRITCTFWKPITIPIDLTVTVPAHR